jgi:hypothetical protein
MVLGPKYVRLTGEVYVDDDKKLLYASIILTGKNFESSSLED